ncbi:MAG: hypothetical protein MRY83_10125, partial [Flavobacteriales bacterium]|nr:hypothetical protein [Flavobacteriales bacterium]
MSTYNLGLAFYRKYYKDWNFSSDPAKPDLPRVKYPKQHTDKKQMEQSYFELKTQPLKEQQLPEKNIYRYT